MKCQRCQSERVAKAGAKCSDMFSVSLGETEHQGYVPGDLGIGGGDYVEFSYCLDCGQLQGKFPLESAAIEKDISDVEVAEFFGNYFTENFAIDNINKRERFRIVEWAKESAPKFGKFMEDFFRYNEGQKFPSVEKFVQMYRQNKSYLEEY